MISVRWRYPWQELWAYKTRSLLVILSIAVGIFAFGMIAGASGTLSRELSSEYKKVQPANAIIHASAFGEEIVEAIRRMPEVAVAEGRRTASLRFLDDNNEWHDLRLFALEDYERNQVDIVRPFGGEWPPADRTLLIERQSLFLTGAAINDSLLVETDDGVQRLLRIGGLTHDMGQAPAQITGVPYGYVNQETLEWLGLPRTFNELHFTVAQNSESVPHIAAVAQDVADKLERNGLTIIWTEVLEPGTHFAQEFLPDHSAHSDNFGCDGTGAERILGHQRCHRHSCPADAADWCDEGDWRSFAADCCAVCGNGSDFWGWGAPYFGAAWSAWC